VQTLDGFLRRASDCPLAFCKVDAQPLASVRASVAEAERGEAFKTYTGAHDSNHVKVRGRLLEPDSGTPPADVLSRSQSHPDYIQRLVQVSQSYHLLTIDSRPAPAVRTPPSIDIEYGCRMVLVLCGRLSSQELDCSDFMLLVKTPYPSNQRIGTVGSLGMSVEAQAQRHRQVQM